MKEILLCKYGEIVLKGANKRFFEDSLCKALRIRAKKYGNFEIIRAQSIIYVEPQDDFADIDGMFDAAMKTFGIVAVGRAAVCEKNLEDIKRITREYIPQFLEGKKSFKVEGKRSDKTFPLNSMELSEELGAEILEATNGRIRVDVRKPEIIVKVEIRERAAYVHAGQFRAAGGLPVGSGGHGMLLLSGGIDSPVAGFMMAKRGLRVEAVHFESFPYTSEMARDKVIRLARTLAAYTGDIYVHVVSLTKIQEEIAKHCEEDYFTLLLRRYMMTIYSVPASEWIRRRLLRSRERSERLIFPSSLMRIAAQSSLPVIPEPSLCLKKCSEKSRSWTLRHLWQRLSRAHTL